MLIKARARFIASAGALLLVAAAADAADAADKLRIAVGQCGNWDSSPVELGDLVQVPLN